MLSSAMDLVAEQQSSDFIEMLGELRIKGALSDGEFQRLKSLVLETNEHGLSKDLLSLLEKFWGHRAKSYLTDDDFKKKKGRLLHDLLNEEELEPASPDPSTNEASKRKRRKEISMRPPAKRAAGDDSGNRRRSGRVSSLSGGGSTSDGQDRSSEPSPPEKEPQEMDASDEGSTITICNSDAGEDKHDTHSIDVPPKVELFKCFHHRRWTATLPLQVPDPGYLEDDVPLTFVDSTAELLEKSQPRRFPAFVGAASPPKASKSKYARQEGMYQRWKKVMVRGRRTGDVGKEKEVVFRATDEEVHDAVEEVVEGTLSLEGYLAEVKRILNRQQLETEH